MAMLRPLEIKVIESALEMRQKQQSFRYDDNLRKSIKDIDRLFSQNEVSLENHYTMGYIFIDLLKSPKN